jgi:hypothetical protein
MNRKSSTVSRSVREIVIGNGIARSVFDHLSSFENNMKCTYIHRVAHATKENESDIREIFKQLEALELGSLILGRKGARTRFEWKAPLKTVAEIGLDEQGAHSDKELLNIEWTPEDDSLEQEPDIRRTNYPFRLREDFSTTLVLPSDFNMRDLERLSGFLKTLPIN